MHFFFFKIYLKILDQFTNEEEGERKETSPSPKMGGTHPERETHLPSP
jgi:hypothetical protein